MFVFGLKSFKSLWEIYFRAPCSLTLHWNDGPENSNKTLMKAKKTKRRKLQLGRILQQRQPGQRQPTTMTTNNQESNNELGKETKVAVIRLKMKGSLNLWLIAVTPSSLHLKRNRLDYQTPRQSIFVCKSETFGWHIIVAKNVQASLNPWLF